MPYAGLSSENAKVLLEKHGPNEISEVLKVSWLEVLFRQVKKNYIVYFLFIAAVLSLLVGKEITGWVILAIIVILIVVGFVQEYKAETAIKALKSMIMPISIVIRNGKETEISASEIVPGDLLVLRLGEKIPADAIVIEQHELKVNESILTGESLEVPKATGTPEEYDKKSTIFMGTLIVNGKCIAQTIHTGMNTEFGKIARMISQAEKELPLKNKINEIAKYMVFVAITFSVLSGLVLIVRAEELTAEVLVEILLVVIALSVSAFPEGFPVVLISTLSYGAIQMAKKNAIVNRMSIIETLGETTVICTDKTGTLTTGQMTVKSIYAANRVFGVTGAGYHGNGDFIFDGKIMNPAHNRAFAKLVDCAVLCNDAAIERKGIDKEYLVRGNPTEAALLVMAAKAGIYKDDFKGTRAGEIPFSSEKKSMHVLYDNEKEKMLYSKGAPEIILENCVYEQTEKGIARMTPQRKQELENICLGFTEEKMRTIAFACKKTGSIDEKNTANMVFLGFAGMEDPPRPEIKYALQLCDIAGIKVKMITGDNLETAIKIGQEIGLEGKSLTGADLDRMTDEELAKVVQETTIFARVRPEHKLKIISALKKNGEIVTMTGDGVNDAPALKEAHIGVAMGKNGTDVSREAADLILKDDNFATIVDAIKEGRTIFDNIRKFVTFQLSCNFAELFIIFIGILLGFPLPLLAIQILFMNMVTDNMPALTLGLNPSSVDIMKRKATQKQKIFAKDNIPLLVFSALIKGVVVLGVFYFTFIVLKKELEVARTITLVTLILMEIVNAFNFRSFRHTTYEMPIMTNKYLLAASIASIMATLIVIYTPLSAYFSTAPIGFLGWGLAIGAGILMLVLMDIFKTIRKAHLPQ